MPNSYLDYLRHKAPPTKKVDLPAQRTTYCNHRTELNGPKVCFNTAEPDGFCQTHTKPIAAGLAIQAEDTGRILMLQRALTETDPASGKWEFPGGTIDPGETPLEAAFREWEEETGHKAPTKGAHSGGWTSSNGVYQGFIFRIPTEQDIEINLDHEDRHVLNPDDPDGDQIETIAWWNPADLQDNPAIREELQGTDWHMFQLNPSLSPPITAQSLQERVNLRLTLLHEFYNDCHDREDGRFCKEGSGTAQHEVRIEQASTTEIKKAHTLALQKTRNAPVPTKAQVKKARLDMKNATRAGGEARGGSAADRRRQRFNLFKEFGGIEKGYVVDHQSGIKLHYTDDKTLNPKQYPLLERGKIFTKVQGGGYTLNNLLPESFDTNRSRNDRPVRKENLN